MKAALGPLDCCGFLWRSRRPARNRLAGAQRRTGADQCDHRRAGTAAAVEADRAAAERSSAFRKHLARHEPHRLMERPAICCAQMRLTRSSRACRACCCPRGFARRQDTAADPGIPRTDDRRARTAVSIAAHAFQRTRLAGYSPRGYLFIMRLYSTARPRRRLRAAICQFFLPIKCARIILHFRLDALDARDRLGP